MKPVAIAWGDQGPYIMGIEGDRGYWGGGTSYRTLPENYQILKEYASFEEADRQFPKDFPKIPVTQAVAKGGWLSPKGELYVCGYGEHVDLSDHLHVQIYDSKEPHIEERGWIRIWTRGMFTCEKRPTPEQMSMLLEMSVADDNAIWVKNMKESIEYARRYWE
jgi:hypothetical protein